MYGRGEGYGAFVGSCLVSPIGVRKVWEGLTRGVAEEKNGEALPTPKGLEQVSGVS